MSFPFSKIVEQEGEDVFLASFLAPFPLGPKTRLQTHAHTHTYMFQEHLVPSVPHLFEVGVDVEDLAVLQDALLIDLNLAGQPCLPTVQQFQTKGTVKVVLVAAPDVPERDFLWTRGHTHV